MCLGMEGLHLIRCFLQGAGDIEIGTLVPHDLVGERSAAEATRTATVLWVASALVGLILLF
jgi:hypothetical protein